MVLRTFGAFDNEAFTVVSSPGNLASGSAIINNSNTPVGTVFEFSDGFPPQVITLDDQDGPPNDNVFNDNDPSDHIITDGAGLVADGTQVESESFHFVRLLDGNGNPTGPEIQITVFSQNGQFTNIWGMATNAELIDGAQYVKVGGSNNGTSDYEEFVCFTPGTLVATDKGERPIETLQPGDRVVTRDNGFQEIRWIGSRALKRSAGMRALLRPVHIKAHAFGDGLPERDIVLSPNHRLLWQCSDMLLFSGHSEVFAAAKSLVGQRGVTRASVREVTYVHLLFDRHEVILADGMWSESFFPGPVALNNLHLDQHNELLRIFPELKGCNGEEVFALARPDARRFELAASRAT
ncbi:MAG: Hint domain-containing protein [Pseudomonadota bacterium]